MPQTEVDQITSDLAEIYGVDVADIETSVDYVASGTIDVTIPPGVSENEAITSLQDSISDVLGVHPKDVVVTIDDNGVVTYSVTGASYAEAEAIQDVTSQVDFASQITDDLNENGSPVTVESSTPNEDIDVVVSATVDTTDATGTSDPVISIENLTIELWLTDSFAEGIINYFF